MPCISFSQNPIFSGAETDMGWLLGDATRNHGCGPQCKRGCLAMMALARPKEAVKLYCETKQLKERVDDRGRHIARSLSASPLLILTYPWSSHATCLFPELIPGVAEASIRSTTRPSSKKKVNDMGLMAAATTSQPQHKSKKKVSVGTRGLSASGDDEDDDEEEEVEAEGRGAARGREREDEAEDRPVAAKRRKRNQRIDILGADLQQRKLERRTVCVAAVSLLRGEYNMCIYSVCGLLNVTKQYLYRAGVLEESAALVRRQTGTWEERGLKDINVLFDDHANCCGYNCFEVVGRSGVAAHRRSYDEASSKAEQGKVIMSLLWDFPTMTKTFLDQGQRHPCRGASVSRDHGWQLRGVRGGGCEGKRGV